MNLRRVLLLAAAGVLVTGCRAWTVLDAETVDSRFFAPGDVELLSDGGLAVVDCSFDSEWGGRGVIVVAPDGSIDNHFLCDGFLDTSPGPDGLIYVARNPEYVDEGEPGNRIETLDPVTGELTIVFEIVPSFRPIYNVTVGLDGTIYFGTHDIDPDSTGERHERIHRVTGPTSSTPLAGTHDLGRRDFGVDADGTIYATALPPFGDPTRHQVLSVTADGTRTVIAGTGTPGFSGDGGPAVAARLRSPAGVDVNAWGYVYVADSGNDRVREIRPDGTITTVAGGGTSTADGALATDADIDGPFNVAAGDAAGFWVTHDSAAGLRVTHVGLTESP